MRNVLSAPPVTMRRVLDQSAHSTLSWCRVTSHSDVAGLSNRNDYRVFLFLFYRVTGVSSLTIFQRFCGLFSLYLVFLFQLYLRTSQSLTAPSWPPVTKSRSSVVDQRTVDTHDECAAKVALTVDPSARKKKQPDQRGNCQRFFSFFRLKFYGPWTPG